jgi:hypothetical protein
MVRQILMASGIRPFLQTYISIWKKPVNAPSWETMLKVLIPKIETATVKQDLELRG